MSVQLEQLETKDGHAFELVINDQRIAIVNKTIIWLITGTANNSEYLSIGERQKLADCVYALAEEMGQEVQSALYQATMTATA